MKKELMWMVLVVSLGVLFATFFWFTTVGLSERMFTLRVGFTIVSGLLGMITGIKIRILNL